LKRYRYPRAELKRRRYPRECPERHESARIKSAELSGFSGKPPP